MRRLILLLVILILVFALWNTAVKYVQQLSHVLQPSTGSIALQPERVKVVTEESVVIDVVKKVGPSVVTVAEQPTDQSTSPFDLGPFSLFGQQYQQQQQGPQNIGSGFIVSSDGYIVTNKHVVSDTGAKYQIITNSDKKYDVQKIYRDPANDIAILKIDPGQNPGQNLPPITLGDSSNLQVGQFVIAIGTALGQFRNTVTTGVISGLGRGITAGDQFQGFAEQLDNVIQTDAAINPGNSGGPLLNSSGQVIGVNTAIAQNGQNIGFALPINIIKDSLNNFNQTGQFNRPYLGVAFKMVNRDLSILNNIPQGAYVQQVITDSAADKAGIKQGDIIVKIDGQSVTEGNNDLSKIIEKKKVGDTITLTVWRPDSADSTTGKTMDLQATLQSAPSQ